MPKGNDYKEDFREQVNYTNILTKIIGDCNDIRIFGSPGKFKIATERLYANLPPKSKEKLTKIKEQIFKEYKEQREEIQSRIVDKKTNIVDKNLLFEKVDAVVFEYGERIFDLCLKELDELNLLLKSRRVFLGHESRKAVSKLAEKDDPDYLETRDTEAF